MTTLKERAIDCNELSARRVLTQTQTQLSLPLRQNCLWGSSGPRICRLLLEVSSMKTIPLGINNSSSNDNHLLITRVASPVLRVIHVIENHVILTATPRGGCSRYARFKDEECEA